MEKSKVLIFDVLVDVVLKSGETLTGYIDNPKMQSPADRDFVKMSNKKVTKGMRSTAKRIKLTQVASISKSTAKTSNF